MKETQNKNFEIKMEPMSNGFLVTTYLVDGDGRKPSDKYVAVDLDAVMVILKYLYDSKL